MVMTVDGAHQSEPEVPGPPAPAPSTESTREPGWRRLARDHPGQTVGILLSAVGVLIVVLGWYGAAHTTVLQYQVPYLISGGMLGSALTVLGGVYTATASTRQHQDRIESLLLDAIYGPVGAERFDEGAIDTRTASSPPTEQRYVVPGGTTFHRRSCSVLRGKSAQPFDAGDDGAMSPCRLCRP